MKNILKKSIPVLGFVLVLGTAIHASAQAPTPEAPKRAPEVDPVLAIGGVSLLLGTVAVVRARRKK